MASVKEWQLLMEERFLHADELRAELDLLTKSLISDRFRADHIFLVVFCFKPYFCI